jgi:glycine/D-amino acid oxidase-like deaminating enzyme
MEHDVIEKSQSPTSADIVVIGAGVIGLFTAWFLGKEGKRVLVLDRNEPMREASGVNAGSMGLQNKRLPLIPYSLESIKIWKSFQEEISNEIGYVECGGVRVATTKEECGDLRSSATNQEKYGLDIEWLEGNVLSERLPWLSEKVKAATYCPSDGYSNPLTVTRPLLQAVYDTGGRIYPQLEVKEIIKNKAGFKLLFNDGALICNTLIVAAGAWSAKIAQLLGIHLDIELDVNMLTVTEPYYPIMNLIITHIKGILTLKQLQHGSCIIGGGWQGRGNLDSGEKTLDYTSLIHNFRLACNIVPSLKQLHLVRCWSGFEGVTPDSLPYLGQLPGIQNAYIAACARGGWTLGPLLGRLTAEMVSYGSPSMNVECFAPDRFL